MEGDGWRKEEWRWSISGPCRHIGATLHLSHTHTMRCKLHILTYQCSTTLYHPANNAALIRHNANNMYQYISVTWIMPHTAPQIMMQLCHTQKNWIFLTSDTTQKMFKYTHPKQAPSPTVFLQNIPSNAIFSILLWKSENFPQWKVFLLGNLKFWLK